MPTAQCTHEGCSKSFTKRSQTMANMALQMHIGRVHTRNILNSPREGGGVIHRSHDHDHEHKENGVLVMKRAGKLSVEERQSIVAFIRDHHTDYPSRAACFHAALEQTGAVGKIKENSVAVCRHFKMAMGPKPKKNGAVGKPRRYDRSIVDKVLNQHSDPISRLECPNCRY